MSNIHPSTGLPLSELDFRMPEFRDAKIEDYEFRGDGKIVRKDRWETGLRRIAYALGFNSRDGFEIDDVVTEAQKIGSKEPIAYMCPDNCGCLWRDNHDDTLTLFGANSKSCQTCEFMGLNELIPLFK
jgi:hypothetical protein